jgi:hypothetical protein
LACATNRMRSRDRCVPTISWGLVSRKQDHAATSIAAAAGCISASGSSLLSLLPPIGARSCGPAQPFGIVEWARACLPPGLAPTGVTSWAVMAEGSIFSGIPAIGSNLAQLIVQILVILALSRLLVALLRPLKQVRESLLSFRWGTMYHGAGCRRVSPLSTMPSTRLQPSVISEIIAGILLGPTALSAIPAFKSAVFPAAVGVVCPCHVAILTYHWFGRDWGRGCSAFRRKPLLSAS